MALFRGIQEYIAIDANNITLVFDSGNIVNISGNIFLYPPQGHPILYKYQVANFKLSWRPIVRLYDGWTDRMENRSKNRAVGARNRTIGCDFEESVGIGRTLTCQTRSDESHPIIYFYHCTKCIMG